MQNVALAPETKRQRVKELAPSFGFLIAFGLPGFVVVAMVLYAFGLLDSWLAGTEQSGKIVFLIMSALTVGVFLSGVRWAIFDKLLMPAAGRKNPETDFGPIMANADTREALTVSIEHCYRHYQFFANTAVAVLVAYGVRFSASSRPALCEGLIETAIMAVIELSLFFSARDALGNYYADQRSLAAVANSGGARDGKR
jgi:hypothetical protein